MSHIRLIFACGHARREPADDLFHSYSNIAVFHSGVVSTAFVFVTCPSCDHPRNLEAREQVRPDWTAISYDVEQYVAQYRLLRVLDSQHLQAFLNLPPRVLTVVANLSSTSRYNDLLGGAAEMEQNREFDHILLDELQYQSSAGYACDRLFRAILAMLDARRTFLEDLYLMQHDLQRLAAEHSGFQPNSLLRGTQGTTRLDEHKTQQLLADWTHYSSETLPKAYRNLSIRMTGPAADSRTFTRPVMDRKRLQAIGDEAMEVHIRSFRIDTNVTPAKPRPRRLWPLPTPESVYDSAVYPPGS